VTGTTRTSEGLDPRRRRVLYRAWRRGTREMDLLLGRFADAVIGDLPDTEIDQFERLIEQIDAEIFDWVIGRVPVPHEQDTALFRRLCAFHGVPGRVPGGVAE